jgi:hypothetical protein
MDNWSQSSNFSIASNEAFDLLRHAPLTVKLSGSSVLHYQAPLGIWEGAPIHYHLVSGMLKTSWGGSVTRFEGKQFFVLLMPSFSGPFSEFRASHSFEDGEKSVVIRDNIEFSAQLASFIDKLLGAVCSYSFDARRWSSELLSEAKTTSFDRIAQAGLAS